MLYLVPTPIGNLKDITLRALEVLKGCDVILCEDTRHSKKLLNHYEILKPLISFHQFSEAAKEDDIITELKSGKNIALISDAGTPGIADPGTRLVARCHTENIATTSLPGPSAVTTALSGSGIDCQGFQFVGFFPRKAEELKKYLSKILQYSGVTIGYESPKRLVKLLKIMAELAPTREITVARELTKIHETYHRGTAKQHVISFTEHPPKGEIVILIPPSTEDESKDWKELTPEEHVNWLITTFAMSTKDAIKLAAEQRGVPKREIYHHIHR